MSFLFFKNPTLWAWMNDNARDKKKKHNIHHWSTGIFGRNFYKNPSFPFSSPFFSEARNLPGALRHLLRFGLQGLSSTRRDLACEAEYPPWNDHRSPPLSRKTQQKSSTQRCPGLKSGDGAVFVHGK